MGKRTRRIRLWGPRCRAAAGPKLGDLEGRGSHTIVTPMWCAAWFFSPVNCGVGRVLREPFVRDFRVGPRPGPRARVPGPSPGPGPWARPRAPGPGPGTRAPGHGPWARVPLQCPTPMNSTHSRQSPKTRPPINQATLQPSADASAVVVLCGSNLDTSFLEKVQRHTHTHTHTQTSTVKTPAMK